MEMVPKTRSTYCVPSREEGCGCCRSRNPVSFRGSGLAPKFPTRCSIDNGRQPRSGRIVIKSGAHQCQRLDHAQAVRQAPAQQEVVSRRYKNSRSREGFGRSNEGLQVHVRFRRGMAEERKVCRVSCDALPALHHPRSALLDCLSQVDASVESVNPP
jgi:hypothetical protein